MKQFFHRHLVWAVIAGVAVAARLVFWRQSSASPFAALHRVPGLDMATHLELGALLAHGAAIFTPYRAQVALLAAPPRIVAAQLAGGVLTALLAAFVARRLTGRRSAAWIAGLAAALYAPALMYEGAVLQESLTALTGIAAVAGLLWAHRRRFAPPAALTAGALLALAGCGRPTALLFVAAALGWTVRQAVRRGRNWRRPLGWTAAGLLLVWLPVATVNWRIGNWPLPFYGGNIGYLAAVGAKSQLTHWSQVAPEQRAAPELAVRIGIGFFRKLPLCFAAAELPDNLNFQFVRQELPLLRRLVAPGLLLTAALTAIVLLLTGGRWRRREGVILLYLTTVMLPVIAYYPTGRHRLILYPALAVLAGLLPELLRRCRSPLVPVLAGTAAAAVVYGVGPEAAIRAADHTAFGLAAERMPGGEARAAAYHRAAFRLAPEQPENLVRAIQPALTADRITEAAEILAAYPHRDAFRSYFAALLLLRGGAPAEAARVLETIRPEALGALAVPGAFYLGECRRLAGDPEGARQSYRTGLTLRPTPRQRALLEAALSRLEKQ